MEVGLSGSESSEAAARPGVVEMDDGADERQKFGDFRAACVSCRSWASTRRAWESNLRRIPPEATA